MKNRLETLNTKRIFEYISYLQYPLMLLALYFMFVPVLKKVDSFWEEYNKALMFLGLAIGFSGLQDVQKTQNKISRVIFESPVYSFYFTMAVFIQVLLFIGFGLFGYFFATNPVIQEVAVGAFMFGLGLIGMLKSVIEMAENHNIRNVGKESLSS